jgi:Mrp family chromosome partitioning ATPase
MDPAHFFAASRVLIVAGKGGVGKTTICATLASAASRAGCSVLILRLTPGGSLPHLFDASEITASGTRLRAASDTRGEITARLITPDEALLDYLADHGLQRITRRLVSSGAVEVVTTAAPGIRDLLVLGRVKQLEVARAADLIIVDAPAAGHAVSFLRAPAGLRDAVTAGPIATQATDVLEMLADPSRARVMLATLPEETPVNEVVETAFALEDEVGVQLGPVVVNGVAPLPEGSTGPESDGRGMDRSTLDGLARELGLEPDQAPDRELLDAMLGASAFRATWVDHQRTQIDRLGAELPLPLITLPLRFTTDLGPADLEVLTDALLSGIESLDGTADR